jgi:hypothetical protein
MSEERPTNVPLDGYAVEAFNTYTAACEQIDQWSEVKAKARDLLVTHLRHHGADAGTVGGHPVIRLVAFEQLRLDPSALKEAEPYTYRKFLRRVSVEQLRLVK